MSQWKQKTEVRLRKRTKLLKVEATQVLLEDFESRRLESSYITRHVTFQDSRTY